MQNVLGKRHSLCGFYENEMHAEKIDSVVIDVSRAVTEIRWAMTVIYTEKFYLMNIVESVA